MVKNFGCLAYESLQLVQNSGITPLRLFKRIELKFISLKKSRDQPKTTNYCTTAFFCLKALKPSTLINDIKMLIVVYY
jgi:hypothetical protein